MFECINKIPIGIFILLGSIITVSVVLYTHRRNKFNEAATAFRSAVIKELEGIYPIKAGMKRDEYIRFKRSIPVVESAANEFMFAVPGRRKDGLRKAIEKYGKQCNAMNWEADAAEKLYGNGEKPLQTEEFNKCVQHLLSFSE